LAGGYIKDGTAADILDNDGNQITGFGSITSLTLWNDGTIEAIGGTLILNTGNQIHNGADALVTIGILEASSGSTLEIHDNVANAATGQIDTTGGTVDFVGTAATTIVVNNLNTTNGIQIDATGTLQLDVGTLELTGTGAVKLAGGSIKAGTAADILDNDGHQLT